MADKNKKVRSVSDTPRHKIGVVLGTGFFLILCAIIIFPVLAGLLASFRPGKVLIRRGLSLDFDISTMSLYNYTYLFSGNADSQKYFMWYKNSLIITIVSVALTLIICYFVAYGLTMYNYKIKNFLFFLVIATMMVPFEILMLPLYKEVIALNIIDTYFQTLDKHLNILEQQIKPLQSKNYEKEFTTFVNNINNSKSFKNIMEDLCKDFNFYQNKISFSSQCLIRYSISR